MDIATLEEQLNEFDALRADDTKSTGMVERIKPEYADEWPTELNPAIRDALNTNGISCLYEHQAEAIRRSIGGKDVVLESPTASGKTIAFSAPMLNYLLQDRDSHALMIYPMKALAFDQREQIRQLCEPLNINSWPYDGDTDTEHRSILREHPPRILLTNPEYLNMSFLGWREKWHGFLQNLKYLVIDEIHEYRGYFGGNMALLLRRFLLHLNRIGASPRIFMSTATCANPEEHARVLTGRDLDVVSARNVLRPKRRFLFVNPAIRDFQYRDILRVRVEQAALSVLAMGLRVLVFCPTKRFLEDAFRNTCDKADEHKFDREKISLFHADLKNDDRQEIQQRIKSGEISVVFTTNALELGLDIGGLDGTILVGFPPSIMSAWQQIGRAGRSWNKDAFVLFYAMNDPIDRFFVGNLDAFLNKPFDELVVDPGNEALIENHLAPLATETGGKLQSEEVDILGRAFFNAGQNMGKPIKGFSPHPRLNIRGGFGKSFKLKSGSEELGQISAMRRFREAYIGAVFTFFGRKYRVHSHEEDAVILTDAEPNLRTEPGFFTVLSATSIFDGLGYGDIETYFGSLDIVMNFTGYKLLDEFTGEEIESGGASDAHFENNLYAFWVNVPNGLDSGIGALEHLFRVGAMFVIPADRFDASTYSKTAEEATTYYYENYSGGIGVAKKLFQVWPNALEKGIEIAENCACKSGCPNCIEPAKSYNISNADIDKVRGIELATTLLANVKNGPDRKFQNGRMVANLDISESALLSEASLAVDWNRPEEDAAWSHLQPEESS